MSPNTNTNPMPENKEQTMTYNDALKSFAPIAQDGWTVHLWTVQPAFDAITEHHTYPVAGWATIQRTYERGNKARLVFPALFDDGCVQTVDEYVAHVKYVCDPAEVVIAHVTGPGEVPPSTEHVLQEARPIDAARRASLRCEEDNRCAVCQSMASAP